MTRRAVYVRAALVLVLVWGSVWGVRSWAARHRVTAATVEAEIHEAALVDLSQQTAAVEEPISPEREARIRGIAEQINQLDFTERQKNRESGVVEEFFRSLSPQEKDLFLDLTIAQAMDKFMVALDAMKPEQRKKFVEQGLKELQAGRTEEELKQTEGLSKEVMERISREGMRAFFQKANRQTKLDLAPLMQSMNEVMQGMRGNEFGIPQNMK